ncbi:MAG: hypothetical protein ACOH2H_25365 [Cypionkella sp.]
MTDILPGKRYGTLQAWPDPAAPPVVSGRWRYLPLSPAPQRDQAGRAQITAMEVGDMLMLTLGTGLSATPADLTAAQAAIAAELGLKPDQIDLRPADATATSAKLVLVDGLTETEVAAARPSPVSPYPAAFSAMLTGDNAKAVKAAMQGQGGRLMVRYDLDLTRSRKATATLQGDWSATSKGDKNNIDEALKAGDLTLTLTADEGASDALKEEARKRAFDQAVQMMARMMPEPVAQPDIKTAGPNTDPDADFAQPLGNRTGGAGSQTRRTADLDVSVTRTEAQTQPLHLESDVADWMK